MKVLVAGGAGFIGYYTTKGLLSRGHEVRILDNLSTGDRDMVDERAEFIEGDVCDRSSIGAAMAGVDGVIHLAGGVAPGPTWQFVVSGANVLGTSEVCRAARNEGVRRIVFSSSAAVYGNVDHLPIDESVLADPISAYGREKTAAEEIVRSCGVEYVILRYFNVYGKWAKADNVVARFVRAVRNEERITLRGDGKQLRDYVHVLSVAFATANALLLPGASCKTTNVGTGVGIAVLSVLGFAGTVAGDRPLVCPVRREGMQSWEIVDSVADTRMLSAILMRGKVPERMSANLVRGCDYG